MSRYIEADAFNKDLQKRWNVNSDHDFADKEVWRALEDAPSIDICFCKDCKHRFVCCRGKIPTDDYGFCSDGERNADPNASNALEVLERSSEWMRKE